MTIERPLRVAVAGLGYWGPNIARNLAALPDVELVWCCDALDTNRARIVPMFPQARITAELDDILGDETVDAVALATPVPTHAALAIRVLEAGKHCFVEKPMAQSAADAEAVVAAARAADRMLMVGHLLECKITVYDKGFDEQAGRGSYGEYITRSGDIWSPRLPNVEPLRTECEHFV